MSGAAMGRSSTLDGLPKQFVVAMRTLFDIMDDRKLGYVHLADIESRWRDEDQHQHAAMNYAGGAGLQPPRGVVESLRKVTPPNGLLSFERFCAGLKICLLRNRPNNAPPDICASSGHLLNDNDGNGKPGLPDATAGLGPNHHRSSSSSSAVAASTSVMRRLDHGPSSSRRSVPSQSVPPIVVVTQRHALADDIGAKSGGSPASSSSSSTMMQPEAAAAGATANKTNELNSKNMNAITTATVRPNTTTPLRTVSMPQLMGSSAAANQTWAPAGGGGPTGASKATSQAARVERLRNYKSETRMVNDDGKPGAVESQRTWAGSAAPGSRHGIMTVLHNWHMGMLGEQQQQHQQQQLAEGTSGGSTDGRAHHQQQVFSGEHRSLEPTSLGAQQQQQQPSSWKGSSLSRRREPRRHTLANGIDYNMLKRMKQLEQEKDVLLQGLEAVDKARAWYLRQIVDVQDKMKYIGHSNGHQEYSMEAHQERLNFEMAQIFEVNQNLSALVESSERGFPLHMNLAVRQPRPPPPPRGDPTVVINHVAELNRQLSAKSERITQLEMEKAALVRELFQARSQATVGTSGLSIHRDTTLM